MLGEEAKLLLNRPPGQPNTEGSPQQVSLGVMPQPIVEQPRNNDNGAGTQMQVYQPSSNSFESIDYLKTLDQLLIEHVRAAFEEWDIVHQFHLKNCLNQKLFQADEESECCTRFCCAPRVQHIALRIFDNFQNEVIRFERSPWERNISAVYSPPGTLIGHARRVFCSCDSTYFVTKDTIGNLVFKIKYPETECCACCPDELPFRIETEDGSEIGYITNLCPYKRQVPAHTDKYRITFPMDLDVTKKILILGACFLMDATMFKTRNY